MGILDPIFPKNCLECNLSGKYICENCLKKVSKSGWYGKNYAVFKYEGVIRRAIIALKYKYSTEIAKELANAVAERFKNYDLRFKNITLVPIPLHNKRFNERGFNQSEILGKQIAQKMNWRFEPNFLIKNKKTLSQVGLKGDTRRKNLFGAFSLNLVHKSLILNRKSIVVFDDVMTTGSTLHEATEVLKKVGAKNVWGLTIAR